jgi:hypothetical protein
MVCELANYEVVKTTNRMAPVADAMDVAAST